MINNTISPRAIIAALALFTFSNCYAQHTQHNDLQKIVIIRHGEKPPQGDNLSCAGLNRAMQLPAVFDKKFGVVNDIFVPSLKTGKSTSVARMYQTAIPYAVKHDLTINTKFDVDDINGLVGSVLKKNGTVLIVWEHKQIHKLLKALGVDSPDKWDDDDFDSIWVISFKNGKPSLTKDKEGISPSQTCQ